ncbi:phosphotransferase [Tychonema sp. LEGE 07199]|uniref:phosphotransferase n=1 Tax=unclassified Tychonema TaxID=2642144 RepID=UPI00187EE22A|nr:MULTISPECIES: phosphotransferase [unclassified Tychonema]MBE9122037.1 phosphotransferase [Tychonema sp. LEGE 07199]MBE9133222.1 phosphotransferase [Tychonema sp. LEGE 07196]
MTCQGKTGFLVSGQLAVGGWRLEVGGWRLAVGGWQLEVGGWRLVVACFPACCRLTTADS